jgi:hypothetical protein
MEVLIKSLSDKDYASTDPLVIKYPFYMSTLEFLYKQL